MIHIEKIDNSSSYKVIFTSNNKEIGTFIQAENGFYYYEANSTGLWIMA